MRLFLAVLFVAFAAFTPWQPARGGSIDGRVFQVEMPSEDITILFWETKSVFTVELRAASASVKGAKMYLGDGNIAVLMTARAMDGIRMQGVSYKQGDEFKKGSKIMVRPGYKKAAELTAGDIYVTLSGVTFEAEKK